MAFLMARRVPCSLQMLALEIRDFICDPWVVVRVAGGMLVGYNMC